MPLQNPYDDSEIKGAGWTDETLKAIKEFVDTLETVVGTIDVATTDSLHGKLGTDTELADYSLYDLLGGNAFKTHALSAMLGALTTTDNLKAILGAYTAAANLKAAIDAITAAGPTQAQMNTAHALLATVAKQNRVLCSMDFWSDPGVSVTVTGSQSTITTGLNNVVVADLPSGATIVRAVAMMKFRMVENTYAGVNKLDAAAALPMQVDDVANTGMLTCIDFADDLFTLAASTREGGDVIIGDIDIAARIDGNDTYDFQWLNAKADQNNIVFYDVQMGLRIWYSL